MEEGRSRWDRKKVLHRHHDALSELDWRDFERLMADGFVVLMGFVFIPAVIKSALAPLAQPRPVRVVQSAPAPPSSVYRADIAAAPIQPTPTVRSAAEQAQREAEAKAYLERVPELTHYKYTPLDANKDLPTDADTPAR